jgi:hypothetical protein
MYKAFNEFEIQPFPTNERTTVSISEDSPCASHVHVFTGIRSLGKINFFDLVDNVSFKTARSREVQYRWAFDQSVLLGQTSLTGRLVDGSFISSADERFTSASNEGSVESHQDVFRLGQGYLYRNDIDLLEGAQSTSALRSSSSANYDTSVIRQINVRKDLFKTSIDETSFRLELNNSNTSLTANIDGASANTGYTTIASGVFGSETPNVSGYTTALDIKNPFGGAEGTSKRSFFGVPVSAALGNVFAVRNGQGYTAGNNLDTIKNACTIEAIIRPYQTDSTIYFRRLASTQADFTKDNFMKLELTQSADGRFPAFRFSIRSVTAAEEFVQDFAKLNIQASGLFVPNDVGINLFDGNFHHIVATWDILEVNDNTSAPRQAPERGAGIVMGYIDGFKLQNREQVSPRLAGSDGAGGPTVQANMVENRIPIKTTPLHAGNVVDPGPSGNNVYIGASNYNRADGDRKGDHGELASTFDARLGGLYDGQIQHLRVWNQRLVDGTTGFNTNVGQTITKTPSTTYSGSGSLALSFTNFKHSTLTSTSASQIVSWWYFNNMNGVTGADICGGLSGSTTPMAADKTGNLSSNTGTVVGNARVKLYDVRDTTLGISGNTIADSQMLDVPRTFLYFDQPSAINPVNNRLNQGRLLRNGIDGSSHRIGLVYYDLGLATIDGDDPNAKMEFTNPVSGTTGDFGFAVTGNLNTSINIERSVIGANTFRGRLILDATASGEEMNFAGNPSGYNPENNEPVFDVPTTYITTVGLYNHQNDLLAIAKLAQPVRKDDAINLTTQVKLDF